MHTNAITTYPIITIIVHTYVLTKFHIHATNIYPKIQKCDHIYLGIPRPQLFSLAPAHYYSSWPRAHDYSFWHPPTIIILGPAPTIILFYYRTLFFYFSCAPRTLSRCYCPEQTHWGTPHFFASEHLHGF